jgi:uncharacterized protein YndB with AHSA1/START domain
VVGWVIDRGGRQDRPATEQGERRRVRRTLEVDVDRHRLWAMIHDPEALGSWLGAEVRLPCPPRAGDHGVFVFPGNRIRLAEVDSVLPASKLVWRWADDDGGEGWTVVTLQLDEIGSERTRLTVTEEAEESYGQPVVPLGFAASGSR